MTTPRTSRRPGYRHERLATVLAGEPARAAIVLARLGGVHRLLHPARGDRLRARARLRRARRRRHRRGLPVGAAPGRCRGAAHGLGPLRSDHVDDFVGAHADPAAGEPAHRPGRQWWPGGGPAGRLGRRGDHALPRRHRGRRHARRRHGGRVGRARLHGGRRLPPRLRRRDRRRGAAAPARRRRARDARPRRAHQGVPRGRPRGDGKGHRTRRRHDGRSHDGEGQRRDRADARPAARPRRPPAGDRRARPRARRGGAARSARAPPTSGSAWCCW